MKKFIQILHSFFYKKSGVCALAILIFVIPNLCDKESIDTALYFTWIHLKPITDILLNFLNITIVQNMRFITFFSLLVLSFILSKSTKYFISGFIYGNKEGCKKLLYLIILCTIVFFILQLFLAKSYPDLLINLLNEYTKSKFLASVILSVTFYKVACDEILSYKNNNLLYSIKRKYISYYIKGIKNQ
ncbi:hypothetical protein [Mannheimia indoligenes]|uniref:hypothetical protein n=1 Tax=Mannheimia indoligenes TaxID=3103145 RepID=UPI002FE6412E